VSDWTNHGRDRQPRVRSCPRQSGDFAGKARRRASSLLRTQSEAVPDHRHLRGRQSWFRAAWSSPTGVSRNLQFSELQTGPFHCSLTWTSGHGVRRGGQPARQQAHHPHPGRRTRHGFQRQRVAWRRWRLGTQRVGIGSWPSIGLRSGQTDAYGGPCLQLRLLQVPLLLGGKAEETAVSRDRGLPFLSSLSPLYYRATMKCGTGTPLYSAISDPTSTHKKTPKATLAYQGSYCLDFLAFGLGIFFSRPKRPGDLP
jgi:hypothetical protein